MNTRSIKFGEEETLAGIHVLNLTKWMYNIWLKFKDSIIKYYKELLENNVIIDMINALNESDQYCE